MIDIQRMVKYIKKMAEEANITITEMEELVLAASINNGMINVTNITQISEDLQYLVQSNMDKWAFEFQRILTDELDQYKGRDNSYVDDNIWEIQELYMEDDQ